MRKLKEGETVIIANEFVENDVCYALSFMRRLSGTKQVITGTIQRGGKVFYKLSGLSQTMWAREWLNPEGCTLYDIVEEDED